MRVPLTALQQRLAVRLRDAASSEARRGTATAPGELSIQWSAVALLLVPDPDAVLLIRRAERVGDPWSGHMGLPGGRLSPEDADLGATARRETREEVGVEIPPEALLGQLEDVSPRTPELGPIVVRPYAFALGHRPALNLNREVADAFWLPLETLRAPGVYGATVIQLRGEARPFPAYHLGDRVVWGLTERILTALLNLA
jgi:8-oxo-dGTP pyrophosphatase MutT (NUDIX family)